MSICTDDADYREWTECRATIARMDSILKDLRKYGFTLVTGLLTAGAFLGAGTGRPEAGVATIIAVMALLATLFSGDTYYSASMSGAVERALDLEARSWPPIRLTRSIHTNCHRASVVWITLGLYVGQLLVALGLGLATAMTTRHAAGALTMVTSLFGLGLLAYMVWYWWYVKVRAKFAEEKPREWPAEPHRVVPPPDTASSQVLHARATAARGALGVSESC
jgi:hypothetical protein